MPVIDIGFSPCPNDTFIFDALVNHKIDTKGYDFKLHLEDVQTLNEWALQGKLPYSKISYGVWPKLKNQYQLLESGGALGKGVGPLLIYKADPSNLSGKPDEKTMRVAIPGMDTTAHLLFSLAFPDITNKVFLVFNFEFLVEKKSPLVLPPSFGELPEPGKEPKNNILSDKKDTSDIEDIINQSSSKSTSKRSEDVKNSIEETIIKKINESKANLTDTKEINLDKTIEEENEKPKEKGFFKRLKNKFNKSDN